MGELQLDVVINDLKKRLDPVRLIVLSCLLSHVQVSDPIINVREACACLPPLEEGKPPRLPMPAVFNSKFFMKVRTWGRVNSRCVCYR